MKVIFDFDYSIDVVDKKLYDKLEAKHEADCRLISEYDLEIKRLEEKCEQLERENRTLNVLLINKTETIGKPVKENDRLDENCERMCTVAKKRLFDFKNAENERDHYKGLYSSKCDDYDNLLAKRLKIEKERDQYKNLFHSLNHKHQKVVGEMKAWKERAMEAEKPDKLRPVLEREIKALEQKLKETEEKYDDACKMNKMREDVFNSNLKLKKTIEAKDREIDLLRAELDKYKTDECDDSWID